MTRILYSNFKLKLNKEMEENDKKANNVVFLGVFLQLVIWQRSNSLLSIAEGYALITEAAVDLRFWSVKVWFISTSKKSFAGCSVISFTMDFLKVNPWKRPSMGWSCYARLDATFKRFGYDLMIRLIHAMKISAKLFFIVVPVRTLMRNTEIDS